MGRKNYNHLKELDKTDEEYISSVQELVNVVLNTPKEKEREDANDNEAFRFIQDLNLRSGPNLIPGFVIYHKYLEWCNNQPALSQVSFFQHFSKKFKKSRRAAWTLYGLASDNFTEYKKLTKKQTLKLKAELQGGAQGDAYANEGGQAHDEEQ